MDGTIRDLAGLRGTYRLIDKTQIAIILIGEMFGKNKVEKAILYLIGKIRDKSLTIKCLSLSTYSK